MRQFQSVPTTYVPEIKETYVELYISRIMSISFAPFKHLNLSIKIKIPVTIWQIVYIYMRAFSPNGEFRTAHAWIWIIFCMLNTYGITTLKMKLFYSSNAVRPQGDTLKYTLFVLIYDILNISLKSLTLLTATIFDWNIKEDFPGYTLLPLMYMSTSR